MEETEKSELDKPVGPVVGIIIIIILLIIGAWYFWTNRLEKIEEQKKVNAALELQNATTTISTPTEIVN
jgi:FtsZ-interacting cell division protein ZipA